MKSIDKVHHVGPCCYNGEKDLFSATYDAAAASHEILSAHTCTCTDMSLSMTYVTLSCLSLNFI